MWTPKLAPSWICLVLLGSFLIILIYHNAKVRIKSVYAIPLPKKISLAVNDRKADKDLIRFNDSNEQNDH